MGFFGLEMGKTGLLAHQVALDVVGHNISNADTPGYSRQIANMQAQSVQGTNGIVGAGVDIQSITRVRNEFLDDSIISENQEHGKWEIREENLKSIQYTFNEPSDESIRFVLDQFWGSMQDLSSNPEDSAVRITMLERASDLSATINNTNEQLLDLQRDLNNEVAVEVASINSSLKQLAELNSQISRLESSNKEANDLRDQRDLLVEEMSTKVNVQLADRDGEYAVIIGGKTAVQAGEYKELEVVSQREVNDGKYSIRWADTKDEMYLSNGSLYGLVELRDDDIENYLGYLDQLSIGLIDTVNDIHKAGFDINGQKGTDFFAPLETETELYDLNADGKDDAAIYKMTGSNIIEDIQNLSLDNDTEITSQQGEMSINGITISYDTSKDTLEHLTNRINEANVGLTASIGPNNRMIFRGDRDSSYVVKELEDTNGTLLQELGILNGNGSYNYKEPSTLDNITKDRMSKPTSGAASEIRVLINDVDKIAAAQGVDTDGDGIADKANNSGDGSNVLRMAGLKDIKSIGQYTFSDYFQSLISDLGVSAQQASRFVNTQDVLIQNLEQRRQSEIGVSLDEEMTNMLKYQHGYNAIAQYITTVNEMYDTLINKL